MANRQKWAQALQGLGAGLTGQGVPYMRNQMVQNQFDEAQRRRDLLQQAYQVQTALSAGRPWEAQDLLLKRFDKLRQKGVDSSDTMALLKQIDAGDLEGALREVSALTSFGLASGELQIPGGAGRAGMVKSYAPQTQPDGTVGIPTFDPNSNTAALVPVPGMTGQTQAQKSQAAVRQAADEQRAVNRVNTSSAIRKQYGDMNREAATAQVKARRALLAAENASQGLTGQSKLFLSRVFPDIDVGDEALLDSSTKELALDILARFKGPTTDFEYGIAQSIVGGVGQSKTANRARLASVDRNLWFMRREAQQFNKWDAAGKDPNQFKFDFEERLKTKKGEFTLMELQETAAHNHITIPEVLKRLNN